jgi:hypothetical protein
MEGKKTGKRENATLYLVFTFSRPLVFIVAIALLPSWKLSFLVTIAT